MELLELVKTLFRGLFIPISDHSTKTQTIFVSQNHSTMATSSSVVSSVPQQHQVFLNFRGDELRNNFVSHLDKALRGKQINVFIDEAVEKGENLDNLFKEIEKSRIALAIISQKYTESKWCLNELVKMKELEGKLVTIPIFYNVEPATVRYQKEAFGAALTKTQENDSDGQMKKWKEALTYVSLLVGFPFNSKRYNFVFLFIFFLCVHPHYLIN